MATSKGTASSILITGASSGIGEALADHYAAQGRHLALTGRSETRLTAVAERLRGRGAEVQTAVVSVTDRAAMAALVAEVDAKAPLDLVIANAGISAGTGGGEEPPEQTRAITATNVEGVLNTVEPALTGMRMRSRGQIGLIASLAGFRGFPGAPAYCASKAWVKVWGEGLRGHLAPQGIGVTVVCPGFVKSRMTAVNDFPMPFLWGSEKAAGRIARGLERNHARVAFPWPLVCAVHLLAGLPPGLVELLQRRLPAKT
ncbi:MAG: SDR family NAD(P)-dependent oxidoreductase [Kiloniellales bacterium]